MGIHSIIVKMALSTTAIVGLGGVNLATAAHSAGISNEFDPLPGAAFDGTSNPPGNAQINVLDDNPGYLNDISGGPDNGASGQIDISDTVALDGAATVLAIAIQVTDSAGSSHSISSDNDPALGDIVNDLNSPQSDGLVTIVAYPFDDAPAQYADDVARLSAGEAKNGGAPFDILAAGTPFFGSFGGTGSIWTFDFSNEIGNLGGITSLNVTDVGSVAVPEPMTASLMILGGIMVLGFRGPIFSLRF